MLSRLSIRDIVLIERLDIDYVAGLSVLTGETGAGKSILLDAFALALGSRGDASLVRNGMEQGQVTAAFEVEPDHPAIALLAENGIGTEDGLILRRVQLADGRTRAFVNDQPVSVQVLKSLGTTLVEIHGQHDERALVDVATHRRLLDAYAGLESDAAAVARLWGERRAAEERVAAHRARVEQARREADWLRHAVDELTKLKPETGEETALDAGAQELKRLEASAGEAEANYAKAAAALSAARKKAAAQLDKTVTAELKPLKLDRARFSTNIETGEGGPDGIDRIEFWVQTNPGTRPGPLMKVASGGELARFLLALKVVLADRGSAPTLVFDEIDTGAGGAVADAIGLRLGRLAEKVQVVAVTHAPQVAARARRHYLITKDALARGKRVATSVSELAADRRREEIARMLAGAEITEEARKAAERLIRAAGQRHSGAERSEEPGIHNHRSRDVLGLHFGERQAWNALHRRDEGPHPPCLPAQKQAHQRVHIPIRRRSPSLVRRVRRSDLRDHPGERVEEVAPRVEGQPD